MTEVPIIQKTSPLICRDWFLYDRNLCHERVKSMEFKLKNIAIVSNFACTATTFFFFCITPTNILTDHIDQLLLPKVE